VERMLQSLGFSTQGAADGEEALRIFRAAHASGERFELAILDLTVVGGMGGRETLAALLALDPAVRVIVSSGYSDDQNLSALRAHGARGFLPKPYRLEELKAVLREVSG